MMAMIHNGWERRCPYCFSRKLKVVDYDVADQKYRHLGYLWFQYKCEKCGGLCEDINSLELKAEKIAKYEAKKNKRGAEVIEKLQTSTEQ